MVTQTIFFFQFSVFFSQAKNNYTLMTSGSTYSDKTKRIVERV